MIMQAVKPLRMRRTHSDRMTVCVCVAKHMLRACVYDPRGLRRPAADQPQS